VRGQARRAAALRHLRSLSRVECSAPLGPESLRALRAAAGGRLRALQLDAAPRMHCPRACLEELCQFEGLEELVVAYNAGRTLTHAAPLGALTNLRRLVRGGARPGREGALGGGQAGAAGGARACLFRY
jgi:hypothetical protein